MEPCPVCPHIHCSGRTLLISSRLPPAADPVGELVRSGDADRVAEPQRPDTPLQACSAIAARAEGELDATDLAQVNRALVDLEYMAGPEELLERDYGRAEPAALARQRPGWVHRFFGFC